jgi:DNA mismatch repair protein MutS2
MDRHALKVLEYPRVLERVAAEAAFSVGRERVLALEPRTDFEGAIAAQQLTAEMVTLDQMGIDVPFGGASDIRPEIDAAAKDRILDPRDFWAVSSTLRAAQRARTTINRVMDRVPRLADIAFAIGNFTDLIDAIERSVDETGSVLDSASEALGSIRRQLIMARSRLDQHARSVLAAAVRQGFVQDAVLTERNGRTVIPVRADFRGRVPGIVHDVSSSGATVFVEPMAVVEAGNEVRELELAEDREIRRILQALTASLGFRAEEAQLAVDALADLDAISARVRYGRRIKAGLPAAGGGVDWIARDGPYVLRRARHPLLTGDVVPTSLEVGGEIPGLVITGPNTGGKTVALKTAGLLAAMAQSGLPVPCDEGSRFPCFEQIFADIGDEQSIEQSLSTFSSHMRNVRLILESAKPGTLVLLDELGAGTDPDEGAALARSIIDVLLERGAILIATTHHGELKTFAHSDPRLRNASVEFNVETLSPTYHLTIGLPGQSNALAIARRLGVDPEVIDRAEMQLSPEHMEIESLLADIRRDRERAEDERSRELTARREAEEIRLDLARRRDAIESERIDILEGARREAEDEMAAFRRELERLKRTSARAFDPAEADRRLRELDDRLGVLRQRAKPKRQAIEQRLDTAAIEPGDRVRVRDIGRTGEALTGVGEDGKVDVQLGSLRLRVSVDRIERADGSQPGRVAPEPAPPPSAPPLEIDVRGRRADDAVATVDTFVDDAFRAGAPFVRIIHGKGTGALRLAIRDHLRHHPLVRDIENPPPNQGGEGVTVAVLAG